MQRLAILVQLGEKLYYRVGPLRLTDEDIMKLTGCTFYEVDIVRASFNYHHESKQVELTNNG